MATNYIVKNFAMTNSDLILFRLFRDKIIQGLFCQSKSLLDNVIPWYANW